MSLGLLVGCSHIPVEDARWIAANAKNIREVEDRLGSPERTDYGRGEATARYQDFGRHVFFSGGMILPGVGLVILFVEEVCFPHMRFLTITYDPATGAIFRVDPRSPAEVARAGG